MQIEVKDNLGDLQRALDEYAKLRPRRAAKQLATKGQQLIHGNQNPKFGRTFPGLYKRMRKETPEEGIITLGRLAALKASQGKGFPIKTRPRARKQSAAMLEGRKSGAFSLIRYGRGNRRIKVQPVRRFTKGKRRGQISTSRKRAKTARIAQGTRTQRLLGYKTYNTLQLSGLLELQYRESGRGFAAASFLPNRYRRLRTATTGARRALVKNKKGRTLSKAIFAATKDEAMFRLTANPAVLGKPWARRAIRRVVKDVTRDIDDYLARKEKEGLQKDLKKNLRRKPR